MSTGTHDETSPTFDPPRLDAGTTRAVAAYQARFRSEAEPGELVFIDSQGRRHNPYGAAALLRAHMEAVGLKRERPELFESTPEAQAHAAAGGGFRPGRRGLDDLHGEALFFPVQVRHKPWIAQADGLVTRGTPRRAIS